jgi:hypothetical protein
VVNEVNDLVRLRGWLEWIYLATMLRAAVSLYPTAAAATAVVLLMQLIDVCTHCFAPELQAQFREQIFLHNRVYLADSWRAAQAIGTDPTSTSHEVSFKLRPSSWVISWEY